MAKTYRDISQARRQQTSAHSGRTRKGVVRGTLTVFRPKGRKSRLDGLLYPSAVTRGGKNLVLFPTSRSYERTFESVTYVCATVLELPDWKSMTDAFSGAAQ